MLGADQEVEPSGAGMGNRCELPDNRLSWDLPPPSGQSTHRPDECPDQHHGNECHEDLDAEPDDDGGLEKHSLEGHASFEELYGEESGDLNRRQAHCD